MSGVKLYIRSTARWRGLWGVSGPGRLSAPSPPINTPTRTSPFHRNRHRVVSPRASPIPLQQPNALYLHNHSISPINRPATHTTTMTLKRKRSEPELCSSPSSCSSIFSSPPSNSAIDVNPQAFYNMPAAHLNSRTMKRFRNNRPSEEIVHRT